MIFPLLLTLSCFFPSSHVVQAHFDFGGSSGGGGTSFARHVGSRLARTNPYFAASSDRSSQPPPWLPSGYDEFGGASEEGPADPSAAFRIRSRPFLWHNNNNNNDDDNEALEGGGHVRLNHNGDVGERRGFSAFVAASAPVIAKATAIAGGIWQFLGYARMASANTLQQQQIGAGTAELMIGGGTDVTMPMKPQINTPLSLFWGSSNKNTLPAFGQGSGSPGNGDLLLESSSGESRQSAAVADSRLRGILKVFCTHMEPSFSSPWQMRRPYQSTSSAFAIRNQRIITNAHGVAYHKIVQVRKHGDSRKYIAKVLHIVHESDLALLTVEDPEFWVDVVPFDLDKVPNLQEKVTVLGYPTGGDKLSITEGIISRVDMARYAHSDVALLVIQIDAAINSGNSGGPALIDNKVVGVAFQAMVDAENIGYLVPTLLIRRLLIDVERNAGNTGFVSLGIGWQNTENPILQEQLGLVERQRAGGRDGTNSSSSSSNRDWSSSYSKPIGGVYIRKVEGMYDTARVIKAGDVLIEFDGNPIGPDGTVAFRGRERLSFAYLLLRKFVGDKAMVTVMRKGRKIGNLEFSLESRKSLIPRYLVPENARPSYYIHSGLVFTVLSHPYLATCFGSHWEDNPYTPLDILNVALLGTPEFDGEQAVVLSHVLTSELTTNFECHHQLLKYVDNTRIRSLKELYDFVEGATASTPIGEERFLEFKFGQSNRTIVTSVNKAREAESRILEDNMITSPASQDLMMSSPQLKPQFHL